MTVRSASVIHFHREGIVVVSLCCLVLQAVMYDAFADRLQDVYWPWSGAAMLCWAPVVTAASAPLVNLWHRAWILRPGEIAAVWFLAAVEAAWPIQVLLSSAS